MAKRTPLQQRKWFYPVVYAALFIVSMLPLYTETPYLPQDTQAVIISLLRVADLPYKAFAPIFHIATLLIIALVFYRPGKMGRLVAGYMGVNYLVIAAIESMGRTEEYGFVVHTGGLVGYMVLAIAWLVVAVKNDLKPAFRRLKLYEYAFLLLALLAFWGPYVAVDTTVRPQFNPLFLLTQPDYGMTFCFTTPVFLLGLILFFPSVDPFAYRITAFTGLIYGLFNVMHWFNPDMRWMGFLHLPLLLLSAYALILPRIQARLPADVHIVAPKETPTH
jgi:hypothetical protein